ncbi:MAG TPA: transketolase, partial [Firmicutes bacterium]|nr:transketolase [Bacillota bacterium]
RAEDKELAIVLVAAGSEVSLAIKVAEKVEKKGFGVRVVSVPCREIYLSQDPIYRAKVIPENVPTLAIELGVGTGWHAINPGGFVGVYDLNRFGASGPGPKVAEHLGFTV